MISAVRGGHCSEARGGLLWVPDDSAPSDLRARCADRVMCAFTRPGGFIPVWRAPGHPEEVSVLENSGLVVRVGDDLTPSVRELLTDGSLVLSPAEPSAQVADAWKNPEAVSVAADGTKVNGHLAWGEAGLEKKTPAGCQRSCGGLLAARRAEPAGGDLVVVYARSVGAVFAAGATVEGQPFNGVARQSIHAASGWQPIEAQPAGGWGKIVSLGWSYLEGKVWVLDEAAGKMRLWKVSPSGGEAEAVGEWASNKKVDAWWLVPDLSGNMLVVSSSEQVKKHEIVVVGVKGAGGVKSTHRAKGALWSSPRVEAGGVMLVVSEGDKKMPTLKRLVELPKKPAKWSDMGDWF